MAEHMQGLIKLRVDPPDKFTGKENFEEFQKRFRSYVILADPALALYIDDASRTSVTRPITYSDINAISLHETHIPEAERRTPAQRQKLAQLLYYLLTTALKEAPYMLLDTISDSNGCEAWRLLVNRYAKNQAHLAMTTLLQLIGFTLPNDETAETKFAHWENEVVKFERLIGKPLYPEIKTGLVVKATGGKLHDHLCLTVHDLGDYKQVKDTIINYAKTRQLKLHSKWDYDSMDIGNVNNEDWSWDYEQGCYTYEVDAMWKKGKRTKKGTKGDGKKGKGNDYKGKDPKGKGRGGGKDTKGKGKDSQKGKYGGQPSKTGKWCTFHNTDTHNTSECNANKAFLAKQRVNALGEELPQEQEPSAEPTIAEPKVAASITRQCVGEHEQDFDNTFKIELGCRAITNLDHGQEQVVATAQLHSDQLTAQSDRIMVDSGAQVCVCPKYYAEEIPLKLLREWQTPKLVTATKAPIQVYGVKYIDYLLDNGNWMCVRYYVTDVASPIVSVNGLEDCNYTVVLGKEPSLYCGELKVNNLMKEKSLYYIVTSGRQHFTGTTIQSIKTTQAVCANEKIPACGDYWKIVDTPSGTKAIRVHRIPRKYFLIPKTKGTMPGSGKEQEPWFHRLGPARTTRYKLETHPTETIEIVDDYKDIDGSHEPLPANWTGETIFDYNPNEDDTKPTSTSVELDGSSMTQLQKSIDHWTKEGIYWTRHHVCERWTLFVPSSTPDGPDIRHLLEERTTTLKFGDETISHKDNWKVDRDKRQEKTWTGTTVFQERSVFPQVMLDDMTDSALVPKQASKPHEPTKEERELHELTHLPFRAWCAVRVKTRA